MTAEAPCGKPVSPGERSGPPLAPTSIKWPLLALFTATVVPIGLAGAFYLRHELAHSRRVATEQLAAVADLKVRQIAGWRKERLDDANWVRRSAFLQDQVRVYFDNPTADTLQNRITEWLTGWVEQFGFRRALLLDTQFEMRLAVPAEANEWDPTLLPMLQRAMQTRTVQMADLHVDPTDGQVKMQMVVPLQVEAGGAASPDPVGVLVLEMDPRDFLFPYIQTWPTPSRTAETLLVRREGDDVVFLNELRHRTGAPLILRFPISQADLPAARLLRAEEGVVEGPDYRGRPVLAAIRRIPASPWGIVAKVDQAEIYSPLRRQAWMTGLLTGGFMLVVLLLSMLLWRQREYRRIQAELHERTRRQEERELLLAELQSKNEELESLVYAASHDLRTPLVNIEGFSKRLESACARLKELAGRSDVPAAVRAEWDQTFDERIPKALNFIHSSVTKMGVLIAGLLRVSRLGGVPLKLQRLDMNRLLEDVVSAQAFQIQQAGADVRVEPLPRCTGDAALINQVFSNLLDNALKYRDPDRPLRVEISGRQEGEFATYQIADTGRGIAPEHQEKIWVLFHRLYPEQDAPGEGLGLKLVRRILDRHRGRVWVESTPGEGCRFHVALPVVRADEDMEPHPAPAASNRGSVGKSAERNL